MDIKTGLSIYNKQWLIEPTAALQMLEFFERVKSGEMKWEYPKAIADGDETERGLSSYKIYQKFFENKRVVMSPDSTWDMREFKGFDGAAVAIIPVSGPLMKSDYCGALGTSTLKRLTQMASNTQSVQSIIFLHDSPGGTVDGTQAFADTIKASPKRTISLIDGYMCSADYWIGCSADEMIATAQTDLIGCIGTMCAFYDYTKQLEARGIVLREYYATASKDKNKEYNDAAKGDGKVLIKELLDPQNDVFLAAVRSNRGGKIDATAEDVLTGKTYTATNALMHGLIDGIEPFDDVLADALKTTTKKTFIINSLNTKKMAEIKTLADLKQEYPTLCAEAKAEGATEERDRCEAYIEYVDIDATAVKEGIASGKNPSQKFFAEMSKKQFAASALEGMEKENKNAKTEQTTTEGVDDDKVNKGSKEKAQADASAARIERFKKANGLK